MISWKSIGIAASICLLFVMTVGQFLDKELPFGIEGQAAEDLTERIEQSINKDGWDKTGIVAWTFAGGRHIWDRNRKLHEYKRGEKRIQHSLDNRVGRVFQSGHWKKINPGSRLEQMAWDSWINDSFWLNPLSKLRDEGVKRALVGKNQLLVTYTAGGNTPGDSYVWTIDEDGRPTDWALWVSVIPIGGLSCTWESWVQLDTGAWIATTHDWGGFKLKLTELEGAYKWEELFEDDPFEGFDSE